MSCCVTSLYPCLYGNDAVSETSDCEFYWKLPAGPPGPEPELPITEIIPADTFFTSNNQSCANGLVNELVNYRLDAAAPCDPCGSLALCVSLQTPSDIQYLDYATAAEGIRFNNDVEDFIFVCFEKLNNPIDQSLPILYTLQTVEDGQPQGTFFGNTAFGDNCWPLDTGRVWRLKIGSVFADVEPSWYNWGFPCDQTCYPTYQFQSFDAFPAGILVCYPKQP